MIPVLYWRLAAFLADLAEAEFALPQMPAYDDMSHTTIFIHGRDRTPLARQAFTTKLRTRAAANDVDGRSFAHLPHFFRSSPKKSVACEHWSGAIAWLHHDQRVRVHEEVEKDVHKEV